MMNATKSEWKRLKKDFKRQAKKYHDLTLSIYTMYDGDVSEYKKEFESPNHAVNLWQYFGHINSAEEMKNNLEMTKFGLKNPKIMAVAVIEGKKTEFFRKMAYRAGSLLPTEVIILLNSQILDNVKDIHSNIDANKNGKPTFAANSDPLATWLNFVLVNIMTFQPERFQRPTIAVDPFTASLLAIDKLNNPIPNKKPFSQNSTTGAKRFKVALSFAGEQRKLVEKIAVKLADVFGQENIFYDNFFKSELARPNLDTYLQEIYHDQSDLIVVFLCEEYDKKEWCGLEWRAIRDLIKKKQDQDIMFISSGNIEIPGVFSIDGYINIKQHTLDEISELIHQRFKQKENAA